MVISDILDLEQENSDITLHKEGLFIRVYERSAYLFVKHGSTRPQPHKARTKRLSGSNELLPWNNEPLQKL